MARNEALVVDRLRERALRRADVGDGRIGAGRGEHVAGCRHEHADGHGDDDELDAGHGLMERPRRGVENLRAHRLHGVHEQRLDEHGIVQRGKRRARDVEEKV